MAIAEAKPCPRRGPLGLGKGLGLRCLFQWEEQFSSVSSWRRDIHPTPWEPWGPWKVHGGGAAEALTRVLGGTWLAGLPKPMGRACTAALRFGEGTREGAGTGVLVEGPIARAAHVGVHTHSAIGAHRKPPEAAAVEGALGVGAVTVHADARRLALIDVCRGHGGGTATGPSHPIPMPHPPLPPPLSSSSPSPWVPLWSSLQFLTHTVAATGCQQEAGFAETCEAPVLVQAHSVGTRGGGCTLVVVWGHQESWGPNRVLAPTLSLGQSCQGDQPGPHVSRDSSRGCGSLKMRCGCQRLVWHGY